jgi:hypothetical protein
MIRPALVLALGLAACHDDSKYYCPLTFGTPEECPEQYEPDTSTSTTATSDQPTTDVSSATGTTHASEPGATQAGTEVDSSTSGETGSSSGEAVNAPPEIGGFMLSAEMVTAPGEVQLLLDASVDVVDVDVYYGDTLLATVPISAFPYTFDVTSQSMCNGWVSLAVTVRDAEGLTDSASAELLCQLPAPGSEVYTRTFPGVSSSGGAAVAALPDGAVIVAGERDGRMALWRLDPDGGLLPNWPRTIAGWTLTDLGDDESSATAVVLDPLGAIIVGGNIKSGVTTRRYLARLSGQGELLWEDAGVKLGEDIAGVEVAPTGEIAAVGSLHTNLGEPDPAYDSSTWVYPPGYHPSQGPIFPDVFGQPASDPIPDEFNKFSERARAVVAHSDGFLVFGEREYFDGDYDFYTRATVQRYTLAGTRDGLLWTSPGAKFGHDAALAATATEDGFLAAGWCRHATPNPPPRQVCVQKFDADGNWVGLFSEPSPTQTEARAVAQDREKKIVLGGFLTKPGQTDAWIFASRGADEPLAWSQKYDAGGWDFATGLGCDAWGHCTWVGFTTIDGKVVLVVSQRQP